MEPAEFVVAEVVTEFTIVPEVRTVSPALSVVEYVTIDTDVEPAPEVTIVLPALSVVVYM